MLYDDDDDDDDVAIGFLCGQPLVWTQLPADLIDLLLAGIVLHIHACRLETWTTLIW